MPVRFHVLGESHYDEGPVDEQHLDPSTTKDVVRTWALKRNSGGAFFTRVASVVLNEAPDTFDRQAAWSEFAFSNFVQEFMAGPRIAPSPAAWKDAQTRFFGQLAITQPEVLVVLGSRQWDQLPSVGVAIPGMKFDVHPDWAPVMDAWLYPYWVAGSLVCTIAVKVVHPSAGFGRWNWRTAAERAHTAAFCHSNVLEWFYDNCELEREAG